MSLSGVRSAAPHDRNNAIDLLRGVAILLVLFHHFCIAYPLGQSALGTVLTHDAVRAIARNGNYGVTLFFAVSGFLITRRACARWGHLGALDARAFYVFRVARILPCLVLLLAVVSALALAGVPIFATHIPGLSSPVALLHAVLAALTFTVNVFIAHHGWANYALGVLWSLSVEEVFYVTFPIVVLLLRRPVLIVAFWSIIVLVGPFYRAAHQDDESGFLFAYFASFDGIAIGAIAAIIAGRWSLSRGTWRVVTVVTIAAMVALYLYRSIGDTNIWGVSAMAAGTAVLLLAASAPGGRSLSGRPLIARIVEWTGRLSYELYLFHLIVLGALRSVWPASSLAATGLARPAMLVLFLAGSCALAALTNRYYAEPLNRRIRRALAPSPQLAVLAAAPVDAREDRLPVAL
ncbi:hypothetical protein AA103196_0466 [Ameyamaea chiangmaiensis NBRC 103196]|uniref:Acyltransferase n=1 Tax=Ameyamaea chiangmaiensis TaxID=442969 RepID=A0A850PJC1_9PROT|nr:acyltransferase [Ameyamaea chiangmaiensis]MBS4074864.1 acyltransferase [Ameyamaea chiangmaiensis]NVN41381.1 acyltransferase [Ameyamaea chiangmaiensis]GBQ63025.1 hypothetical protein AA103196_0466 [Ameyamaea chiangmaiensis NBRC 103196]